MMAARSSYDSSSMGLVDLKKVPPVPLQKTLLLVNNFVSNTVRFLNHFSNMADEKLLKVSEKITEMEISVAMLEAKLRSVPELQQRAAAVQEPAIAVPPPLPAVLETTDAVAAPPASAEDDGGSLPTISLPFLPSSVQGPVPPSAAEEAPAAESGMVPASQHPDYAVYFKLIKVGVPDPVVRVKMTSLGLDATVLDNPNILMPAPPPQEE